MDACGTTGPYLGVGTQVLETLLSEKTFQYVVQ